MPRQTFDYDGPGWQIRKLASGVTYDYYYNDEWQLLEERFNSNSNPRNQYVWHPYYIDALAVRYYDADRDGELGENNDGAHYYVQDANFNVTAVVNASGTVLQRYAYTPYGELKSYGANFTGGGTNIGNTHLYTGRERDFETGLQLNRHRYYAAHLGRWINRDPIGYEGSKWNLYEYVRSQPRRHTDPNGTDCPGCDLPDWVGFDNNPCTRACCAQHDRCFYQNECDWRCWGYNAAGAAAGGFLGGGARGIGLGLRIAGLFSSCAQCNNDVLVCVAGCAIGNHMKGKPEWFCAGGPKGGGYITIGPRPIDDYRTLDDAKQACCD